jgi:hypothetical protein
MTFVAGAGVGGAGLGGGTSDFDDSLTFKVKAVPEPSIVALLGGRGARANVARPAVKVKGSGCFRPFPA